MLRGVDKRHEVDPGMLLRDTRTVGQRVGAFMRERSSVSILLLSLGAVCAFYPVVADIALILGILLFFYTYTRKQMLPFRMPKRAKTKDFNDIKPGSTSPNMARGIAFFGNDKATNEELWFNNDDMRTHALIFGSTGSGKTEALISISYNALLHGSGFIYVDGKGDNSLYAKIFSLVRSMGREDDLLLINFMTGARDIVGPQESRLSNTLNPFSTGSSSMLSQLVVSLMDSSSQSSDGDMWKGRAINFVEALMKILVYMRDQGFLLLDANTFRNYFHLSRLESIVIDRQFPRDNQEPVSLDGVPELVMEPLGNYVLNLPGYNKEKKGQQVSQVLEQHGFITMQLTRAFSSLADTYGHILRTNLAEVDFRDVVVNRRILVVLLPALEKSPDELANLGKIIIASLKAMMAAGLGEEVEGEFHDVVERKPTNAPTPYICILDEYGYYAVKGFAVVPAQARSLGFSTIFAGQDLPAFQKASKEEAASIGANTNIKICMKLEDPTETWDFFTKTAGEAYVTKVDAFQTKETSMTNSYLDTKSSSFEKRARIDLLDLKDQTEGEAHIFFKSKIIRARLFYANPKPVKVLRLNHFVKIAAPPDQLLEQLEQRLLGFQRVLDAEEFVMDEVPENEDIEAVVAAFRAQPEGEPIERSVAVLKAYNERLSQPEEEEKEEEPEDMLNIFTALRADDEQRKALLTDDIAAFSQPLLERGPVRMGMHTIEKLSGRTEQHARDIANEIISDMRLATQYPPDMIDDITPDELTAIAEELVSSIQTARLKEPDMDDEDDFFDFD